MSSQSLCASIPIPSQQRVFLWRVLVLLFHWARPLRQTRPVRGITGGLPAGSGTGQAQDLEEPLETLLPQAQEGRVGHHPASSDLAVCNYRDFKRADRLWCCSGGRWIRTTVKRSNRLRLTTVGLGCWTSWIWPFLTFSWVSNVVWHHTSSPKGKRFLHCRGSLVRVCLVSQGTWIGTIMRPLKSLEMRPSSSTWTMAEGTSLLCLLLVRSLLFQVGTSEITFPLWW